MDMLFKPSIAIPHSKECCSLHIVRSVPRSLYVRKYESPALSMPVEVVSNMLRLVSDLSHDPISQSISLSHVCRQWRRIALSTPSLWTFIHLSLPLSKNQLARTCTWIMRSCNRPLDIHMDLRDPSWDWDELSHVFHGKAMESVMRVLMPQATRWRSIELLTDTWAPIFAFLSSTSIIESAPLLHTIRLARCNEYFIAPGETFRPAHLALPVAWFRGGSGLHHLRHVSLSGVHVDWTRSGLTGLRELELRYHARDVMPTLPEFRRLLGGNAATLARLVMLRWGPRMDHAPEDGRKRDTQATIVLPRLEKLEFGFVDVGYAVDLLSLFDLPNLRVLAVEDVASGMQLCERQDCSVLFDRLVEMSATPHASLPVPLACLGALTLRGVHAGDMSIRGLFGRLCAVTSLCLDRVDAAPLTAICSALDACDRLQTLTLRDIDAAALTLVLSSHLFPARLRLFLDMDEGGDEAVDQVGEEDVSSNVWQ